MRGLFQYKMHGSPVESQEEKTTNGTTYVLVQTVISPSTNSMRSAQDTFVLASRSNFCPCIPRIMCRLFASL